MHEENSFLTLTYSDENLPADGSLNYRHFQLFMKRLRKEYGPVRFFMCGEYGELTKRPHYHAILFGRDFPDKVYHGKSPGGYDMFKSQSLDDLWALGYCTVGQVTKQSAGYVARYCMKKVTGDRAEDHYNGREPEFAHMSLKPGIGASFFDKFVKDMLPCDYVIHDGWKIPVPKYYEKLYKGEDIEDIKYRREVYSRRFKENNTDERLKVREEVAEARVKMLRRSAVE
ncbi:MAG: replication initiator protein [Microviridae sp.]|nr:MAG: replication initiator protein [Microviridae sp.]